MFHVLLPSHTGIRCAFEFKVQLFKAPSTTPLYGMICDLVRTVKPGNSYLSLHKANPFLLFISFYRVNTLTG